MKPQSLKRITKSLEAVLAELGAAGLRDRDVRHRYAEFWDYRLIDNKGINDDLRFRVLKEAKGRCALCGASNKDMALHVDHILPRNKGGKTVHENLQALCEKCNRTKRDRDDTDFRGYGTESKSQEIPFFEKKWILENERAFAVLDGYRVTEGHTLICPRRSFADVFEASRAEMEAIWELTNQRKRQLTQDGKSAHSRRECLQPSSDTRTRTLDRTGKNPGGDQTIKFIPKDQELRQPLSGRRAIFHCPGRTS